MTWNEYFQAVGGVSFDHRVLLHGILTHFATSARFECWQSDFEYGALFRYVQQERDALAAIGIVNELFEWMVSCGHYDKETGHNDNMLTFDVTPKLIQSFQRFRQATQGDEDAPFLPGMCEVIT